MGKGRGSRQQGGLRNVNKKVPKEANGKRNNEKMMEGGRWREGKRKESQNFE